jgi:hypothetical protein
MDLLESWKSKIDTSGDFCALDPQISLAEEHVIRPVALLVIKKLLAGAEEGFT